MAIEPNKDSSPIDSNEDNQQSPQENDQQLSQEELNLGGHNCKCKCKGGCGACCIPPPPKKKHCKPCGKHSHRRNPYYPDPYKFPNGHH